MKTPPGRRPLHPPDPPTRPRARPARWPPHAKFGRPRAVRVPPAFSSDPVPGLPGGRTSDPAAAAAVLGSGGPRFRSVGRVVGVGRRFSSEPYTSAVHVGRKTAGTDARMSGDWRPSKPSEAGGGGRMYYRLIISFSHNRFEERSYAQRKINRAKTSGVIHPWPSS